jgi:RimJ/RimL family protein N-acetyltransferase
MKIIKRIETPRLIIRPMRQQDLNSFLDFMLDNDSTCYLMFTEEQKTRKGATELFNFVINSYNSDEPIHSYSIALKDDTYIGSCGLSKILDLNNVYECYYSLLKKYTNKGYATEAMKSLIEYCFDNLEINEIRAYMHPDNPNSEAVAKRIGMNYDGLQKHPVFGNKGKKYVIKK